MKKEPRNRPFIVMMGENDKERLRRAAIQDGRTMSTYAYRVLMRSLQRGNKKV